MDFYQYQSKQTPEMSNEAMQLITGIMLR